MSCLLAALLTAEESEHHRTPPPDEDDAVPGSRPCPRHSGHSSRLALWRRPSPELRHLLHSPPLHRSYGLDGRSFGWSSRWQLTEQLTPHPHH